MCHTIQLATIVGTPVLVDVDTVLNILILLTAFAVSYIARPLMLGSVRGFFQLTKAAFFMLGLA